MLRLVLGVPGGVAESGAAVDSDVTDHVGGDQPLDSFVFAQNDSGEEDDLDRLLEGLGGRGPAPASPPRSDPPIPEPEAEAGTGAEVEAKAKAKAEAAAPQPDAEAQASWSAPALDRQTLGALGILLNPSDFRGEDIRRALERVDEVAKQLDMKETTIYDLTCLVLFDFLSTKPESATKVRDILTKMVIEGKYGRKDKIGLMQTLARLHNYKNSTPLQRGVAIDVFNAVRDSGSPDAFAAGLSGALRLVDEKSITLRGYLEKYIDLAKEKKSPIAAYGTDEEKEIGDLYLGGVWQYGTRYPNEMLPLIDKMNEAWFTNPGHKVLWNSLMVVSELEGKYEYIVDDGNGGTKKYSVSLYNVVEDRWESMYASLEPDRQAEIAKHVVRQLPQDVFPLHVALLDYIIDEGDKKIHLAVLSALKELNVNNVNERTLVRCYLRLIEKPGVRDQAIWEGDKKHDLPHLVVKYLVDEDAINLRDPAHRFMVDRRPFYETEDRVEGKKSEPPIVRYGIPLLEEGEIEKVRDEAASAINATSPVALERRGAEFEKIVPQCNETVDILYAERRKHVGLIQLNVGLIPGRAVMDRFEDRPLREDLIGWSLGLDWLSDESDSGNRLLLGAIYEQDFDDPWDSWFAAGLRAGVAWEFGDFMFKIPAVLKYVRMNGIMDTGHRISLERDSTGGLYRTVENTYTANGVSLSVAPEAGWNVFRTKLGRGSTFGVNLFARLDTGLYFNWVSDDKCPSAVNPFGHDVTVANPQNGKGRDITVRNAGTRLACRKNETHFGREIGETLGVLGEYQW